MLQEITEWLVVCFALTGMASLGLGLKFQAIVAPWRDPLLVLALVVVNFVVAPGIAWALTQVIPLDADHTAGLLLLAAAAGAPFLPKLVQLARGDVALSVGVMVLQLVGTLGFLPLALPWLIPGIEADAWAIARPLLMLLLLPLVVGLLTQRFLPHLALRLAPVLGFVSTLSLLAATVFLLILNFQSFLGTLGSGAAVVGVIFVLLCVLAGALAGRVRSGAAGVMGLATGQRNIAAALVIATSNQMRPAVVVMLLLTTFVGLLVLGVAVDWWRRQAGGQEPGR